MIVLDASAAFELVAGSAVGGLVAARMAGEPVAAPSFMCVEVASIMRRLVLSEQLRASSALQALGALRKLDIVSWPPDPLVERAFELRGSLTAYDAAYVALAEELGVPLVTCDRALAGSNGHHATIEIIPN